MKRIVALLMALLLANTFIAFVSIRPALSDPTTLIVPDQYLTIQDALAHAGQGDTIMVKNGTYYGENMVITQKGLTLQGADKANTIIDGKGTPHYPHAVIVVNADDVVIRGFTIRNATFVYAFGVFLNRSNNAYLADNIFLENFWSIRANYCTNLTVASSTFLGDTGGAAVSTDNYCQGGLIENNTIDSDYVGAFIKNSTGFMVRNNNFSSCIYIGVVVSYSERNWVVRNKFTSCDKSIHIKYNGNNVVIGNTISYSTTAGLLLEEHSLNNVIHHNNFISNAKQVNFEGSSLPPTIWSNTSGSISEGNYWNDYNGKDTDKNGIGNTAYYIDPNNQDQYPLIGPFREFTVTSQTGTYNVYAISNSTIKDFSFNPAAKQISFNVSDSSGALGICRVVFPTALFNQPYAVYVNGASPATSGSAWNSTHWVLYFSYIHGSQPSNVIIVPEFTTVLMATFLVILTLLVAVLKRKSRKFAATPNSSELDSFQHFDQWISNATN